MKKDLDSLKIKKDDLTSQTSCKTGTQSSQKSATQSSKKSGTQSNKKSGSQSGKQRKRMVIEEVESEEDEKPKGKS